MRSDRPATSCCERRPRALVLASVTLVLAAALVVGCTDGRKAWTPFRVPPAGVLEVDGEVVDLDAQTAEQALARSAGCISCHSDVHDPHPSVDNISCVDCHGGDGLATTVEEGHPQPKHPERWPKGGANPERSYTLLNDEHWDWIRFVNPGDLRVAPKTCGPCHAEEVLAVSKSLMTNAAHFYGVAAYANGIVSSKRSIFGESYSPEGRNQLVHSYVRDENGNWVDPTPEQIEKHSLAPVLAPLPQWEITQVGNVYRVFEQGSRLGGPALGFNGLPVPLVGIPDKLEDPGRPNNRLSDRGLGTSNRVDLPILNVHKTRLNDPMLSFLGTNDQPGDYRSSGCTACHVVYANDRSWFSSGPYAAHGNMGMTAPDNPDPTIAKGAPGHPIAHEFTTGIPSSQCMVCHMHQPNSFVNSYYGFTMWSYETDGHFFWPQEQADPTHAELVQGMLRNPEEAAVRGLWGDLDFLKDSAQRVNPKARHTQFADYHGHGWMFRAVFRMNRKGDLLDKDGQVIPYDDPDKFKGTVPFVGATDPHNQKPADHATQARRAVHMKDIHAEVGMHCVDCHFRNDSHGDGNVYAEYQAAVEIRCEDCHGNAREYASLRTSGPAAQAPGHEPLYLTDLLTPDGERRFEKQGNRIIQRSMVNPGMEWTISQVKDSVTPGNPDYNERAAYYKTIRRDNRTWGSMPSDDGELAHTSEDMECYACHTSWITACFGCHLPQRANMKGPVNHFEPNKVLRNFASYNPQVVRDAEFLLGVAPNVKNNTIAPVRSSSAVLISSEDAQRRRIYGGIPTMAANGMSSQIFNTHFPHTVRKTETRTCDDCHLSVNDDNNAWMAQVMLLGTNQVGFMGVNTFVGCGTDGFHAVRTAEWEEPQAVIGSSFHDLAYPKSYGEHQDRGRILARARHHGGTDIRSLQHRGEYLFTASGAGGFRVYDIAQVNNKDFSEKLVTSPVSPLGQDTHVSTSFATAVALPTNQYVSMSRLFRPENKEQGYEYRGKTQNLHESYRYAYVSDLHDGLVIVDVDCLSDGDPQNNFIEKVASFNPDGLLDGAVNLAVAGTTVYVCCDAGVVAIDIDDPLEPRVIGTVGAPAVVKPRSIAVQFRYAFVCDEQGVKVLDVTVPEQMAAVPGAHVEIADARDIYVAKTYGYVAAGAQGLVILDLEKAVSPRIDQVWDADGQIDDLCQVKVAMTNDSVFGYLADGRNGLRVAELVTPQDGGRSAYGFSPRPQPSLIARYPTHGRCLAVSKALDRDRAVDESGHQMTVFGRIGGRPMNLEEMRKLYLKDGQVWKVSNDPPLRSTGGGPTAEIPNRGH